MIRHPGHRLRALGLALTASTLAVSGTVRAGAAEGRDLSPIQPDLDYHSFANLEQLRVTRLELDLRVDSAAKVLRGVVGLQIKRLDPSATELILDTRDIVI